MIKRIGMKQMNKYINTEINRNASKCWEIEATLPHNRLQTKKDIYLQHDRITLWR